MRTSYQINFKINMPSDCKKHDKPAQTGMAIKVCWQRKIKFWKDSLDKNL